MLSFNINDNNFHHKKYSIEPSIQWGQCIDMLMRSQSKLCLSPYQQNDCFCNLDCTRCGFSIFVEKGKYRNIFLDWPFARSMLGTFWISHLNPYWWASVCWNRTPTPSYAVGYRNCLTSQKSCFSSVRSISKTNLRPNLNSIFS